MGEPLLGTRTQRIFIGTVLAQGIIVLVMVALISRYVHEHVTFDTPRYKTVPMYLSSFALAVVFELSMAFDALKRRNIIQLIAILVFHVLLILLAGLEYYQTQNALLDPTTCAAFPASYVQCSGPGTLMAKLNPFLITVPCVLGASWIAMLFCIRGLYFEFGWDIFHIVGADIKAKTMYQYYQVMVCLLKFDLFLYLAVEIQLLIVVLQRGTADFGITIATIPLAVVAFALSAYALRREFKWMMAACLLMLAGVVGLLVYKLVKYFKPYHNAVNPYLTGRDVLTVFTVFALATFVATIGIGMRCYADFHKGLFDAKNHVVTENTIFGLPLTSSGKEKIADRQSSYTGGAPVAAQMSIE
ncbi:hypothetical protein FIBSPDRAFT_172554 [Athelia psychrophila]|uniref:Uncharacterized protein n=1 Tax=Athelia psychrophila TaxID=1759441 RepID=A0A166AVH6_9AGAM|nr:hypothetical protein FIBSPDRAFT_172554 [Fibularhizoctonia sp. CBS 109695]